MTTYPFHFLCTMSSRASLRLSSRLNQFKRGNTRLVGLFCYGSLTDIKVSTEKGKRCIGLRADVIYMAFPF